MNDASFSSVRKVHCNDSALLSGMHPSGRSVHFLYSFSAQSKGQKRLIYKGGCKILAVLQAYRRTVCVLRREPPGKLLRFIFLIPLLTISPLDQKQDKCFPNSLAIFPKEGASLVLVYFIKDTYGGAFNLAECFCVCVREPRLLHFSAAA